MNIIAIPAQTVPAATLTISDSPSFVATDDPVARTVTVHVKDSPFAFVLWSGDAYTAAGDWTQATLNTAALAYLNSIKA